MRFCLVAAGLALGFGTGAEAAVLVVNSTGNLNPFVPATIAQFNPSLGTLEYIVARATISYSSTYVLVGPSPAWPATVTASGNATICGCYGGAGAVPLAVSVSGSTTYNGPTAFFTASASGSNSVTFNTGLSDFLGTGVMQYIALGGVSVHATDANGPIVLNPVPNSGGLSGHLTLEYHYLTGTEPAVPEPASWAMMISGFGLIGGGMRRRATLALA